MDTYLSNVTDWFSSEEDSECEKRFSFLFSNFPEEKTPLNRYSYEEKSNFWKTHITNTSRVGLLSKGDRLKINFENVVACFRRKGVYPICLRTVLNELEVSNSIINTQTWQKRTEDTSALKIISKLATSLYYAGKIISVKFRNLLFPPLNIESGVNEPNDYILLSIAKEIGDHTLKNVLSQNLGYTERLMSIGSFADFLNKSNLELQESASKELKCPQEHKVNLTPFDIIVLIVLLSESGKVAFGGFKHLNDTESLMRMYIKLSNIGSITDFVNRITNADRKIIQIKEIKSNIEQRLSIIEDHIITSKTKAKDYVSLKDRKMALESLKYARAQQGIYDRIKAALENINYMLDCIDRMEIDNKILLAYESGAQASEMFRKYHNLSPENAEEILDKFSESLYENEEISDILSSRIDEIQDSTNNKYTEDDLDKELQELVSSNESKVEEPQLNRDGNDEDKLVSNNESKVKESHLSQNENGDDELVERIKKLNIESKDPNPDEKEEILL